MDAAIIQKKLRASAWIVIGFALFTVFGAIPGTGVFLNPILNLILPDADHLGSAFGPLAMAVIGGIAFGWGATLLMLAGEPAKTHPELIRGIAIRGFLAWFVLDSTFSVVSGVPLNVVGNIIFLIAVLWPLKAGLQSATLDRA